MSTEEAGGLAAPKTRTREVCRLIVGARACSIRAREMWFAWTVCVLSHRGRCVLSRMSRTQTSHVCANEDLVRLRVHRRHCATPRAAHTRRCASFHTCSRGVLWRAHRERILSISRVLRYRWRALVPHCALNLAARGVCVCASVCVALCEMVNTVEDHSVRLSGDVLSC